MRTWLRNWLLLTKVDEHSSHWKVFSLTRWTCSCMRRFAMRTKRFSHVLHTKGFSPRCSRACVRSSPAVWKLDEHSSHLFSFSPTKCVLRWDWRCENWEKHLWHLSHLNGLFPVWTRVWIRRSFFLWKLDAHSMHLNVFSSSECVFLCAWRFGSRA